MENNKIEKIFKPRWSFLIIALVLLVISVVGYSFVAKKEKEEIIPQAIDYYKLIGNCADEENMYVKVSIQYIAQFAEGGTDKYYYIQDEYGYVYIARLSDDTVEKILKSYDNGIHTYKLEGYIFDIPSDIKALAISTINDVFEYASINESNYEEYLGKTYLNEYVTPYTETNGLIIGGGIILDCIAIVFLVLFFVSIIKLNKCNKCFNVDDIKDELSRNTAKTFEKEYVYLTDHYIISMVNGLLRVTKYDDLLWIYNKILRQNGIKVNVFLIGMTKNKKEIKLANSLKEDKLNHIVQLIYEKNKDILVGFTEENKKEYKLYIKNNKKDK